MTGALRKLITKTGVVTGIAPGTTTVTVTTEDGGFTDSCTVTVSELGEITFTATASAAHPAHMRAIG